MIHASHVIISNPLRHHDQVMRLIILIDEPIREQRFRDEPDLFQHFTNMRLLRGNLHEHPFQPTLPSNLKHFIRQTFPKTDAPDTTPDLLSRRISGSIW